MNRLIGLLFILSIPLLHLAIFTASARADGMAEQASLDIKSDGPANPSPVPVYDNSTVKFNVVLTSDPSENDPPPG
jgi:hypothetical protein